MATALGLLTQIPSSSLSKASDSCITESTAIPMTSTTQTWKGFF